LIVWSAASSLRTLRGIHCEGQPAPAAGEDGIVVGVVKDELTGVTQPIATVVAEWVDPESGRRSVRSGTDGSGVFTLCAVPPEIPARLRAEFFEETQGEVVLERGAGGFLLQDIPVLLSRPGRIVGQVTDASTGEPIPSAVITLRGTELRTLANQEGRFLFPEVDPGRYEVQLEHLAYGTQTRVVDVGSATLEVNARFSREAIELEGITVTARSARLERAGYFERRDMRRAVARFMERDEIMARDSNSLSAAFFNIPGVVVDPLGPDGPQLRESLGRGGEGCPLSFFLNGMYIPSGVSFETIRPEEVEAVEVYPRRDDLPYRYRVMPGRRECGGAVFVWTTR
jgi:hypothetical protein